MTAPAVWVVRAGKHGEDEELALDKGIAVVRFNEFGDLHDFASIDGLTDAYLNEHSDAPRARAVNYARQLWSLKELIKIGDTIVLPLKLRRGQIAIGQVVGRYAYTTIGGESRHTIAVDWTHPDVPRSAFAQDLLHSFGAFLTVFRVQRNDAERRVAAVLTGSPDVEPAVESPTDGGDQPSTRMPAVVSADERDLEQEALDQIVKRIWDAFPAHEMSRLVAAVLEAEGFHTTVSPPGPDGGADILAGAGPLGLDSPRICVQVKATVDPADVKVLRELNGTMQAFSAEQGLLVSWSGVTQPAFKEARQHSFRIRIWDQNDLVRAVYRTYGKLPAEIRAELKLKQVWMLVPDEAGEAE